MKNFYGILWLIISLTLLSACTHRHVTSGKPPEKDTRAQCLWQCERHFNACQQTCQNSCPKCQKTANKKASNSYDDYRNQLKVTGGYDIRQLNSYRDPLQCRKTSCNCPADLVVCRQSCKGTIYKTLRKAPFCT
ncbi:MAG: acyltransferase [Legionellaceae bacterium]|nr:acyltransferase [Legionellaceae bacterium]